MADKKNGSERKSGQRLFANFGSVSGFEKLAIRIHSLQRYVRNFLSPAFLENRRVLRKLLG